MSIRTQCHGLSLYIYNVYACVYAISCIIFMLYVCVRMFPKKGGNIYTVCAEKNDRSLTFNNEISRKDRAMKLMAYERTWSNVQYGWVSLSYHENSLSGLVFYKNKNIAHSQPSHQS